jgi:hypothetical protein
MNAKLKALGLALFAALALGALAASAASAASFGLKDVAVESLDEEGSPAIEAGTHPFAIVTSMAVETEIDPDSGLVVPAEEAKDVKISFPPGIVGNPTAVPQCPAADFLAGKSGECSDASGVGVAEVEFGEPGKIVVVPIYNLVPSPGVAAKLGFIVEDRAPVTVDIGINPDSPSNVVASATNISQALFFLRAKVTVWGVPAAEAHDSQRGSCALKIGLCPVNLPENPFLTLPTKCSAPLTFGFEADSWQNPNPPVWFKTSASIGGNATPASPTACSKVLFKPEIKAQPTTTAGGSATGLDFDVDFDDPGLVSATGTAQATIDKAVVTLPQGMTLNPSIAEGLQTCSEAQLKAETAFSPPGAGCPQASKVGIVEVETPLLEGKLLKGSLFVATQDANPFNSLIAIYMVIQDPELGISIKLPGRVSPDPTTGQLVTTFGEGAYPIPQVPFSHFRFHFRAGDRAPLISPPTCGIHTATALFTPSSGAAPVQTSSSFAITSGPGGGPCPAGVPPFSPGFEAGSISNAAGTYSPFYMRLTRKDAEQDMTRFSAVLPPGVTGKIAGLAQCPQAAVLAAKSKDGRLEQISPSCPATSRIGRTLTGAGVGNSLTYVPGNLYLGGPYGGAPLSVVAIVPAVAGPFDVGTVVVQEALKLNPNTAVVEVDGAASDPIPHILAGIPLNVRDLRVYVDRPEFTLNPTSCEPSQVNATLAGSAADPINPADDVAVPLAARFQAASCASLAFKPKLSLTLKGGTKRSANTALSATYTSRKGDANLAGAVVTLPPSQFIDNAHINNPCTREQFARQACPPASVLGSAKAITPLLDAPLQGKVYFRSNGGERDLPDVVAALKGQFDFNVVIAVLTSENERVRTKVLNAPDAPVSKFTIKLAGGKKGLLENSENLCARTQRAGLKLIGQNGRLHKVQPVVKTSCGGGKK